MAIYGLKDAQFNSEHFKRKQIGPVRSRGRESTKTTHKKVGPKTAENHLKWVFVTLEKCQGQNLSSFLK